VCFDKITATKKKDVKSEKKDITIQEMCCTHHRDRHI
jgi:hypothetical protein